MVLFVACLACLAMAGSGEPGPIHAVELVPATCGGAELGMTAIPIRPASGKAWDAVLVFGVPVPSSPVPVQRLVSLTTGWDERKTNSRFGVLTLPPDERAGRVGHLTLVARGTFESGRHDVTILFEDPSGDYTEGVTMALDIPPVDRNTLLVSRPVVARREPDGWLHVLQSEKGIGSRSLDESFRHFLTGGDVEPLFSTVLRPEEEFVGSSEICIFKPKGTPPDTEVRRRIRRSHDDSIAYQFDVVPLNMTRTGKVYCHRSRDVIAAQSLPPGEYEFEIELARESTAIRSRTTSFSIGEYGRNRGDAMLLARATHPMPNAGSRGCRTFSGPHRRLMRANWPYWVWAAHPCSGGSPFSSNADCGYMEPQDPYPRRPVWIPARGSTLPPSRERASNGRVGRTGGYGSAGRAGGYARAGRTGGYGSATRTGGGGSTSNSGSSSRTGGNGGGGRTGRAGR
jgi:hypothetical protein